MELKTLKNFKGYTYFNEDDNDMSNYNSCTVGIFIGTKNEATKVIEHRDLKRVAIEWIKELNKN